MKHRHTTALILLFEAEPGIESSIGEEGEGVGEGVGGGEDAGRGGEDVGRGGVLEDDVVSSGGRPSATVIFQPRNW